MNTGRSRYSRTSRRRSSILTSRSSADNWSNSGYGTGFDKYGLTKPFRKCEQIVPFIKRISLQESEDHEKVEEFLKQDISKIDLASNTSNQAKMKIKNIKKKELEFFQKLLLKARYDEFSTIQFLKNISDLDKSEETIFYGNKSKKLYYGICNDRRMTRYAEWKPVPIEEDEFKKSAVKGDMLELLDLETHTILSSSRFSSRRDDDNDLASNYKGYATSKYSGGSETGRSGADDRSTVFGGTGSAKSHVHGGGGGGGGGSNTGRSGTQSRAATGTLYTSADTEMSQSQRAPVPIDIFSDLTVLLPEPRIKTRNFPLKKEDVYVSNYFYLYGYHNYYIYLLHVTNIYYILLYTYYLKKNGV